MWMRISLPQRSQRTPCFKHSVFSASSVANLYVLRFFDFEVLLIRGLAYL